MNNCIGSQKYAHLAQADHGLRPTDQQVPTGGLKHMTDSMSRYGQAAGMVGVGADPMGRPPGAGPPPPSALSPWQGYVYGSVDPGVRTLAPFAAQAYRAPYPPFTGQYVEPYDQYLTGPPVPPDYPPPINIRYTGPGDIKPGPGGGGVGNNGGPPENNGMGGYPAASALPPFSTIAATVGPGGRGPPTPGLKDEMGEFNEGLGARINRGGGANSGRPPTPGNGDFGNEGRMGGRVGEDNPNASPTSSVQYRPWEAGTAPRGDHSGGGPSSHSSPASPTSSYNFVEGFLKMDGGPPPSMEKGGGCGAPPNSNNNNNHHQHHNHPGVGGNNRHDGSPGPGGLHDDKWFHGKEGKSVEKHGKDGNGQPGGAGLTIGGGKNGNGNDTVSGGPSQQGYGGGGGVGGEGSSGAEDSKGHYPANYDGRDMLLSFGNSHPANQFDNYYAAPAVAGGPWGYPADVPGKAPPGNYQGGGGGGGQRGYNQNGRDVGVYGNGSGPDRQYQLSPHDKLTPTPTPPPPPPVSYHTGASGGGGGRGTKGKRGRGSRGGATGGQHHHHAQQQQQQQHGMDKMGGGLDEYGGRPPKRQTESDDPSNPGSDKPKKKKRKRCGECYGCQRKDNCGDCAPCRNEKSHQICKVRRCEKLIERKPNSHHANASATAAATSSQPPTPPPPPPTLNVPNPAHLPPPPHAHSPVSDKLQYLGGGGGGGAGPASWW